MDLTSKQWFQIISGIIASLITAGALFTTLFGQDLTLKIIAVLGLSNIVLNSIGAALSGQANLVKDVVAMPGVERISINAQANSTLAAAATDPTQPKVGATSPEVRATLIETARG